MRVIDGIKARVRDKENGNPYTKTNNPNVNKYRGQDCVFLGVLNNANGEEEKGLFAIQSNETSETLPVILPLSEIIFIDNDLEMIFKFLTPAKN